MARPTRCCVGPGQFAGREKICIDGFETDRLYRSRTKEEREKTCRQTAIVQHRQHVLNLYNKTTCAQGVSLPLVRRPVIVPVKHA